MQEIEDVEWIIWNSSLGIRDFVTIGRIDTDENVGWLESPYQMVGPFSLDELSSTAQISFAQCVVMSKQRWQDERESLLEISRIKQRKAQQQFFEDLDKQNRRKRRNHTDEFEAYRILLGLPTSGTLEITQIKSAYRKTAKMAHPDAGGNHELFVRIKEAYDALLELV
jgi:hypothetical protein